MKVFKNIRLKQFNCFKINSRQFATELTNKQTKWNTVVGLEIHAQISSKSKLFSGAGTKFAEPVNSSVSFFDCATPGTLPTLNKKCVEAGVFTALALSCQVNEVSLFDRKHYFYADLPAGYQITQQRQPLAVGGELKFNVYTPGIHKEPYPKFSKIKQIQLEQDSGKSLHDERRGWSLVDLNRAGIPLMELVFEPDLSDGEEAAALVKELMIILQRLDTCSCKMEEGALRVDANISVNKLNEPLGVRTEVKNIGSVRAVAGAIKYEIQRQIKTLEAGGKIVNETLSWDAERRKTVSMRDKEEKQDYRFMPEPNLPPLRLHMKENDENHLNLIDVNNIKRQLPPMPEEIRANLTTQYGLSPQMATIIVSEYQLLKIFEDIMEENNKRIPKTVANVIVNQFLEVMNENKVKLDKLVISSNQIGESIDLLQSEDINLDTAKNVYQKLLEDPSKTPKQIVEEQQWQQINDEAELIEICQAVIDEDVKMVTAFKAGKKRVWRAILNKVFSKSNGRANMKHVVKILKNLLQVDDTKK